MTRCLDTRGRWFNLSNDYAGKGIESLYAWFRAEQVWTWLKQYRHPKTRRKHPVTRHQAGIKQVKLSCIWCGAEKLVTAAEARDTSAYGSPASDFYLAHGEVAHQCKYAGLRPARLPCHRILIRRTAMVLP